jgi:Family of unknown function (DUF6544)
MSTCADSAVAVDGRHHARLPALVDGYLERALPGVRTAPAQVEITQTGSMWTKPGGRPIHFTATERLAVERVAFCWAARFHIAPVVALKVRDCYGSDRGALTVRALGVPVRQQAGPDTAVGEAYRYLAELPWVPFAISTNDELEWTELDARTVELACHAQGQRLAVTFDFDASGDIFRCRAAARPRDVDGRSVPTPWGGDLSDYRTLGGVRLPTRGEVYWDLPEGRFVYWRGVITGVRLLDRPFTLESSG